MFITDHVPANPGALKRFPVEIAPTPDPGDGISPSRSTAYDKVAADVGSAAPDSSTDSQEPPRSQPGRPLRLWEKAEFSFGDLIDVINPLQHIPIVATIYRNMSGDQLGVIPRVIGGALWGRLGGLVAGVVNAVVEWFTGKDIGDHIYAALFGKSGESASQTEVVHGVEPPDETGATQSSIHYEGAQSVQNPTAPRASTENDSAKAALISGEKSWVSLQPKPLTSAALMRCAAFSPYLRHRHDEKLQESASLRFRAYV